VRGAGDAPTNGTAGAGIAPSPAAAHASSTPLAFRRIIAPSGQAIAVDIDPLSLLCRLATDDVALLLDEGFEKRRGLGSQGRDIGAAPEDVGLRVQYEGAKGEAASARHNRTLTDGTPPSQGAFWKTFGEPKEPLAQERLEPRPHGLVRIVLKKAYADGTLAVEMDPLSLLCRLA
jgi:hypothetical protein